MTRNFINKRLIIYLNIVLFVLAFAVGNLYDLYNKKQLASFILESQRNNIIIRDYSAMASNLSALNGIFHRIDVKSQETENTILNTKEPVTWDLKIVTELKNNHSHSAQSLGRIVFYYDGFNMLFLGLVLWISLILFINPLFIRFSFHLQKVKNIERELEVTKEISYLARQVAHDIRAPLSALNAISYRLANDQSEYSSLIVSISKRINAVAEDLLSISRKNNQKKFPELAFHPCESLTQIVAEVYATNGHKVSISYSPNEEDKQLICIGDESKFQQMSSNIIQNAIESSSKKYRDFFRIDINVQKNDKFAIIEFEDYGVGIPESIMGKIGNYGFSYGKKHSASGNGLGLYFAKQSLSAWGGSLKFLSKGSEGVKVILQLKRIN